MVDVVSIVIACYVATLLWAYKTWVKMPVPKYKRSDNSIKITVVVAVRNEANNIGGLLEDLAKQTYPASLFEVIIVDDHSTDNTVNRVEEFSSSFSLRLMRSNGQGKKSAVTTGVEAAMGELVVSTDGDCRVGEGWLMGYADFYEQQRPAFISGPVVLDEAGNVFEKMQVIEMASLIGAGAISMEVGSPNMCNGANIAYQRDVFKELKGFEGNVNVASGDDEFFMHKVVKKYPNRVKFLKHPAVIVRTAPQNSVSAFYHQRKRWASKWGAYKNIGPKLVGLLVYGFHLLLLVALGLVVSGHYPTPIFFTQIAFKVLFEFVFLQSILLFLGKRIHLFSFVLLELCYGPYVVLFGFVSRFGRYNWKERKMK